MGCVTCTRDIGVTMTDATPGSAETPADAAASAPASGEAAPAASADPVVEADPAGEPEAPAGSPAAEQTSLATPPPAARGLSYAVDIVFCVDVTGSMTPILDQVKANALRFYSDVQSNLTAKGKTIDELRVRVVAFRDIVADGEAALLESPFFELPADETGFSGFVNGLVAEGGGDAPESGLEGVAPAMTTPWTTPGGPRRPGVGGWTGPPAAPFDAP